MVNASFSHVAVMCSDPIAVEKFYSEHFGFRRARVYAPGPEQVVMLKSGNSYLELFRTADKRPMPAPTEAGPSYPCWRHICFLVDDLEAKLKELGSGTRVTLGPVDMGSFIPGMKVAWIADPEGNIVELNQGYVDELNPPPLGG